ncbi:MAG TPA: VOC family protein [Acidimicrobiales bacterium]|nr:VOC family protein [Acidimicrobiales bacterium]
MSVLLNPYITFGGNAREAIEFYLSVFGGEVSIMTFGEMPGVPTAPDEAAKVMHSMLTGVNGLVLMAADAPKGSDFHPFNGSISLSGEDESTLRGYWEKLVEGGTVGEPLEQAPWGDTFGMCIDRFGIHWMINITGS